MRPIRRSLSLAACVACAATIAAMAMSSCGDNATDPTRQTGTALQKVAGDEQVVFPGEDARAPLRVRAIGADGGPVPGVTVSWAVTAGQATLARAQSVTESSGETETRVTIGATIGSVVVRATVQGAAPISFTLASLDPCAIGSEPDIPFDIPVIGRLQPLDCDQDGRPHDFYRLTVTRQQALIIFLSSQSFDPLVRFFDLRGDPRERGGAWDTLETREAFMRWILAPGTYRLAASAIAGPMAGSYQLSVGVTSESASFCNFKWIVPGITTAQTLASTDCVDYSGPFHEDEFVLALSRGERVTLTHSSTQFLPRLRLFRRSGQLIADATGNASGTAAISFTSDETALYFVRASSALAERRFFPPGESGAYTLSVSPPGISAATAAAQQRSLSLSLSLSATAAKEDE